jgi:hypothetical protein
MDGNRIGMTTQSFLIGPIKDGIRHDSKPWAQPNDSFETLINAYQWRDRVVRRTGYSFLGRLDNNTPVMGLRTRELFAINAQELIAFDTTNDYFFNTVTEVFNPLPSFMPVTWSGTDYQFFYTINYAGAFWATNGKPGLHGYIITGAFANQAGFGLAAQVDVTAAGNTFVVGDIVYFINVAGIAAANNLAYGQVIAINVGGNPAVFTVQSLNPLPTFAFVNGAVTSGMVLSSTNAVAGQDGIRYYGDLNYGGSTVHTSWANYNPPLDPNNALVGALLIFAYRGYLVFLNTTEGNELGTFNFGNRARWTQIGTPYYSLPIPAVPNLQTWDPTAARDDLFGQGGANDASTNEIIIGAAFIRDILVVYFERSTWRLRFVNNSQNPFVWERVNVELGSDSTFSTIPFDKGLMAIGNRGIVISDSNDTIRFDEKIPDEIFTIRSTNQGFQRVFGIRTFRTRLNYWTFPSPENPDGIYPDQVLVFNYETKNWSFFDDTFTCFGYFYNYKVGYTWNDLTDPWPDYSGMSVSNSVTQEGLETIIAGNQQGFVFRLEQPGSQNDPSLFISAITVSAIAPYTVITSPNHNLPDGTWIKLTEVEGVTSDDGVTFNDRNFKISNPTEDPNTFSINEFQSQDGGSASGASYSFISAFFPIIAGSVQINIGSLVFRDASANGILSEDASLGSGTINYNSGAINLTFAPAIGATDVFIRVVSWDAEQGIEPVVSTGVYVPEGLITKISNILIETKVFNFFDGDQKARLSKIDFYTNSTSSGQFTANVLGDSSNEVINTPLNDNLQSNIVSTVPSQYQIGTGPENIFRLYCDATAQTVQVQMTLSDQQMAVDVVNESDIQLNAMMFSMRRAGRIV